MGDIEAIGEGKSKKESKKNSAIKMLDELKNRNLIDSTILPAEQQKEQMATNSSVSEEDKKIKNKKRVKNIIKAIKENPDYGKGTLNPICRLIQIQQANKGPEPVYELVEEKKKFRRQEFIVQVTVGDKKCVGNGTSKGKAKQNAAQSMLVLLGYQPLPQPQIHFILHPTQPNPPQLPKPALKTQSNKIQRVNNLNSDTGGVVIEKKVKFVDLETDRDEGKKI